MERGGSSCCGAVEEGGRGRADGRQMGAALGEMRATYARKCSQSMPWLKMHGNLRRIGPRKTNGYFLQEIEASWRGKRRFGEASRDLQLKMPP